MALGALGLGLVTVAATGARRADTAYERLDEATLGPDAFADGSSLDDQTVRRIRDLPGVEGFARFTVLPIAPAPLVPPNDGIAFGAIDPDFLTTVLRPHVVDGRRADPEATDEIVVNEAMAEAADLQPGDEVTLNAGWEDPQELGPATVVGIVRTTFDVGPSAGGAVALLSHAFYETLDPALSEGASANAVARLEDGTGGVDAFTAAVSDALGQPVQLESAAAGEGVIEDSLRVQAAGYALLAGVAALATVLAIAQGFARLLGQAFVDLPTLQAMGFRPRDRLRTGLLLVLPVAVAGPMLAVGLGWLASDRVPTGFARAVDPLSGRRLDATLTLALAAAWLVLLLALAVFLAWREGVRRREPLARRRRWLPRPPDLRSRLGVDAALRRPGQPGGAAARSALVTASVGIAGLVAVATFAGSLSHLLDTPRLQGWGFDADVQTFEAVPPARFREQTAALADDPAVAGVGYGELSGVSFNGTLAETVVLADGGNPLQPTIGSGRAAVADDEVVLGTSALADAGVGLGDTVTAEGPAGTRELTVVGTAAYPMLGNQTDTTRLATITRGAARSLGAEPMSNQAFVDLRPGHDAEELRDIADAVGGDVIGPFENSSIRNVREVRGFPWAVGAFFALVALVTIAHGLLRSVAVRRREFAELGALGLTRHDRRRVVAAQGLTVAVVASTLGLVFGIVGGTWGWSLLADSLGVVDESVVPAATLAAVTGAAVAVCVMTALAAPRLVRLRIGRDLRAPE